MDEEDYLKCRCGWEGFASELLGIETGGSSCYFGCPDCRREDNFKIIKSGKAILNEAKGGGCECGEG